eukprot:gene8756-9691_t
MADLSEVFELSKIPFSRSFFIEKSENKSEVILSSKSNGFVRCNVENRKVVQSWPSISQFQPLNTSCVFHSAEQKYYAVLQWKNLYCWSNSDNHMSKASVTQLKIANEVRQLHPVTCGGIKDLLIIDSRGTAFLLSKLQELPSNTPGNDGLEQKYIWSDLVGDKEQSIQLATVLEKAQKFKLNLVTLACRNDMLVFEGSSQVVLTPQVKGAHLISCTRQEERIVILWSDNSICVYDLNFNNRDFTEKHDYQLSSKLTQKISPEYRVAGKGFVKAKIGSIDSDHVFIVSDFVSGEKKSGSVAVFNSKFGTEQARIIFQLSGNEECTTREQAILSAQYHAGHVIIALSNSVKATSCSIHSSSLAASLGKLKRTRSEMVMVDKAISHESPFFVTSKLKNLTKDEYWTQKFTARNNEEQNALHRLSDPKKTPTIKEFSCELDTYLKKLRLTVEERQKEEVAKECLSDGESLKKKRKRNPKDKIPNLIVPESFIEAVFNRCLSNDEFWSSNAIIKVLKTTCVPQSLCGNLIQKCLETNSLEILEMCFRHVKGISERDIVVSLKHILSQQPLENSEEENLKRLGKPDVKDTVVLSILHYSFNDYTMQEALRLLNKQETKKFMQTLFHLLLSQSYGNEVDLSHEKVLDWLSLVINAKFTSLILSRELRKTFKKINTIVENQMKFFEKLGSIEPYLLYFEKNTTSIFTPTKTSYLQALMFNGLIILFITGLLFLVFTFYFLICSCYYCSNCFPSVLKPRPSKSRSLRFLIAFFAVISCAPLGLGFYGNDKTMSGVKDFSRSATDIYNKFDLYKFKNLVITQYIKKDATKSLNNLKEELSLYFIPMPDLLTNLDTMFENTVKQLDMNGNTINGSDFSLKNMASQAAKYDEISITIQAILSLLFMLASISVEVPLSVGAADICMNPKAAITQYMTNPVYQAVGNYYIDCFNGTGNPLFKDYNTTRNMMLQIDKILTNLESDASILQLKGNISVPYITDMRKAISNSRTDLDHLVKIMDCKYINQNYKNGINALCFTVLNGLSLLILAAMIISLFLVCKLICITPLWKSMAKLRSVKRSILRRTTPGSVHLVTGSYSGPPGGSENFLDSSWDTSLDASYKSIDDDQRDTQRAGRYDTSETVPLVLRGGNHERPPSYHAVHGDTEFLSVEEDRKRHHSAESST